MKEDHVGLCVGGQFNIHYQDYTDPGNFFEGADDEERVAGVLQAFL